MKRFVRHITIVALILGAALSCQKEILSEEHTSSVNPTGKTLWTFSAGVERTETKLSFDDNEHSFAWQSGIDRANILWDGGSVVATVTVSEGKATFSADGLPSAGTDVWLVCHGSDSEFSGINLSAGNLIIPMPSATKDAPDAYLVAKAQIGDGSVTFCHPVCFHKFVVDGDGSDVTRLTLTSAANTITASSLSLSFGEEGPAASVSDGGASSITCDFSGDGTYYIPFIPGETEASDLTFQFYRGEAKTEKAGALKYGAALDNARASIVNWASLPAMTTNRYVSLEGVSPFNGTSIAPWTPAQFKAFLENSASRTAETLELFDGVKVHLTGSGETLYKFGSKIQPNIAIKVNVIGDISGQKVKIDGNSSYALFDNYSKAAMNLSFKNITFQNGKNTGDNGGAFRIASGSVSFDDCVFWNNNVTASNKKGGVFSIWGSSTLTVKNSRFTKNSSTAYGGVLAAESASVNVSFENCNFGGGADGQRNSSEKGGVLYIKNSSVSLTGCTFNNNSATNWGSCVHMEDNSTGKLYADGCVFKNNSAESRGIIAPRSNNLLYLNCVTFYNNTFTKENDVWGMAIHGQNAIVCMNNVTIHGNTGAGTQYVCAGAIEGGWLVTNSTVVNDAVHSLIRVSGSNARKSAFCNNILINTAAANNPFALTGSSNTGCHNVMSRSSAPSNYTGTDDKLSVTTLTDGTYSEPVYTWTNDLTGFTAASQSIVETVYDAYDETQAGITHVGSDFKAWLNSIGALGKDGRSVTRTGTWWPGAYQK